MAISFGSINTGLPKDIVKQIIAAEQVPVQQMEKRKEKVQDKQKLVTDLIDLMQKVKQNLANNSSARNLRELKVDTNEDVLGVTVDKNLANTGTYQIEVMELAQKSSAMSSGFADRKESYLGVGYIQYFLPNGESKDLYVDSDNSSLDGVANLINTNPETGLRATVINDGSGSDTPWRLLLSYADTGDNNLVEFPYLYFVDGDEDLYFEFEREARDAKVKIDGFEVEVPENKVKDLIPGMTLDLKKAKPGEEFTLKIGEDTEAVTGKINDLVETINGVLKFIKEQNTIDEKTDTSRTLGGDLILQTIEGRVRSAVFSDVLTESGYRRLADLGISFQKDGLLGMDQKKFDAALASDFNAVSQTLTGYYAPNGTRSQGFIQRFQGMVDTVLKYPDGVLTTRKNSLQSKMADIDRRIEQKQRLIEQKEKNLKEKFARLEETISRIKTQGAGLAALGAQSADPVQQLG